MQPIIETIRQNKIAFLLGLAIIILLLFPLVTFIHGQQHNTQIISPIARSNEPIHCIPIISPTATPTDIPTDIPPVAPITPVDQFNYITPTDTPFIDQSGLNNNTGGNQ